MFIMSTANAAIRKAAKNADVFFWQISAEIGVSAPTLTVWLRQPLSTEKKQLVMNAIHTLTENRKAVEMP